MKVNVKERRLYVYVLEFRDGLISFSGIPTSGWVLKTADGTLVQTYTRVSKTSATNMAASLLKAFWLVARQKSELRIRNKNGTFAPARTYPRSADPRRSKG